MKKRSYVTLAAVAGVFAGASTSFGVAETVAFAANSSSHFTLSQKRILLNGVPLSTPMGFSSSNTTYLPIWYAKPLLDKLGISSTWDGHNWRLVIPSTLHADLGNLPKGTAPDTISLDGVIVAKDTAIAYPDPSSHKLTTFVPIWYLMQVLHRLQINSTWDGRDWNIQYRPAASFVAYMKNGTKIGNYTSLQAAQQALAAIGGGDPGAVVKDSQGNLVFTQPDFAAFTSAGKNLGDFVAESAAQAMLTGTVPQPGGLVRDENQNGKVVFTAPDYESVSATGQVIGDFLTESAAQATLMGTPGQPGGVVKDKNQNSQVVFTAPDFRALSASGQSLGDFLTQTEAQVVLVNSPGGVVKDSTGNVVFTEPDFAAYNGPLQTPTDYTTEAAAAAAIQNSPTGFVVNQQTQQIVQMPRNYYWLTATGTWMQSTGTPTLAQPGYAQVGQALVSLSSSNSGSNQMYLLGQANSTGAYTYVGHVVGGYDWVDLRFPSPSSVTANQIDTWLQSNNSPLSGLGSAYVYAQNQYGVNATYLVAHSILESAWGKSSIAQNDNNLFGYGAFDSNPGYFAGKFPSDEYAIRFEAWEVRNNYLNPGASLFYQWPTLIGMNQNYATSTTWANSIGQLMGQYVSQTNGSAADYVQYSPTVTPPAPPTNQEPVYLLNGAQALITPNPYVNLPMYPDWYTGESNMFPGVLQNGDSGSAVQHLQHLLNQNGASLVEDGQFGPATQSALMAYQQGQQLPTTGIYDLATWGRLNNIVQANYPTVKQGTSVVVDQIIQGMLAGRVTEWFHVKLPSGQAGWVDSQYVQFQNVYTLQPVSTATSVIPVYASPQTGAPEVIQLHQGDYVVNNTQTKGTAGFVQIQIVNQMTGSLITGYIDTASAQLAALN